MYLKSGIGAAFATALMLSTNAIADIEISAGSTVAPVAPGDTVSIPLVFDCQAGETPQAAQWDIEYDSTLFSNVDVTNCLSDADSNFNSCVVAGNGDAIGVGIDAVRVSLLNNPAAVICPDGVPTTGSVGTVSFTVDAAAAPQVIPLVVTDEVIDGGFPTILVDGSIDVAAPAGEGFYSSTPAPGETLDFGVSVVGTTATAIDTLNVANLSPDTPFDITAFAMTSGPAGVLPPFPAVPQTIPAGGNADQPIACTPSVRGDNSGTFEVTHDALGGAASPVSYGFACAGLAPNVAAAPLTVTLAGVIGAANPTGTFDVTNADDGFTSDALNAALSEGAVPEISIVTGLPDTTISIDEVNTVTVECSTAAAGMFSEVLALQFDDPVSGGVGQIDVTVNCDIANAFPVYESVPTPGSTLAFGTVTNGTVSAPLGVDVGNSGSVGGADLNVTAASLTGANAAQFDLTFAPFTVADGAAPDGTDDITVTCSPDTTGAFTADLVVNTDDPAEPAGGFTYPLTCEGESDGTFVADPAAGSALNLGIVPPATTTPEGFIDFSNTGAVDDITVSCSVSDTGGVITFMPDPIDFTIAPGDTASVGFQCTPPTPDVFSADVMCAIGGDVDTQTADFTVLCQGQPLVIPTMNRWGLMLLTLILLMVAGFAGRRTLSNRG